MSGNIVEPSFLSNHNDDKRKVVVEPETNFENTFVKEFVGDDFYEKSYNDIKKLKNGVWTDPNESCKVQYKLGYKKALRDLASWLNNFRADVDDADLIQLTQFIESSFFRVSPEDILEASKSKKKEVSFSVPTWRVKNAARILRSLEGKKILNEDFNPFWVEEKKDEFGDSYDGMGLTIDILSRLTKKLK